MAMLRRLSSRFDNDSNTCTAESAGVYGTWQQLLKDLKIDPVAIAWNADGAAALEILREKYGPRFASLRDALLDETVRRYRGRGKKEQYEALGTAIQRLGLYFCNIDLNTIQKYYCVVTIERYNEMTQKCEPRALHRLICCLFNVISLRHDKSLENPADDLLIPASAMHLYEEDNCTPYLLDHFLIIAIIDQKVRMI